MGYDPPKTLYYIYIPMLSYTLQYGYYFLKCSYLQKINTKMADSDEDECNLFAPDEEESVQSDEESQDPLSSKVFFPQIKKNLLGQDDGG